MNLRLRQLDPAFMRIEKPGKLYQQVDDLEAAQGIRFLCPACFEANGGPVGTHVVLCWFRDKGVPTEEVPKPGRWAVSGTCFDDLSLSPSVLITSGCRWHGFVRNGAIQ